MAKRRQLTPAERAAAAIFARHVAESELGLEEIAGRIGVTAGAIGHWSRGELTIPLERVGQVAQVVKADPSEISVKWQESVSRYLDNTTRKPIPVQGNGSDGRQRIEPVNPATIESSSGSGYLRLDPVILDKADLWVRQQEGAQARAFEGIERWKRLAAAYEMYANDVPSLAAKKERRGMAEGRAKIPKKQGVKRDARAPKPRGHGKHGG